MFGPAVICLHGMGLKFNMAKFRIENHPVLTILPDGQYNQYVVKQKYWSYGEKGLTLLALWDKMALQFQT